MKHELKMLFMRDLLDPLSRIPNTNSWTRRRSWPMRFRRTSRRMPARPSTRAPTRSATMTSPIGTTSSKPELTNSAGRSRKTSPGKPSMLEILKAFENTPDSLTEFSLNAFNGLVDQLTVYAKVEIRFIFRNGQEIRA